MPGQSVFDMKVSRVYPLLVAKKAGLPTANPSPAKPGMATAQIGDLRRATAERKGRTKAEVDAVIAWLTGYDMTSVDPEMTWSEFFNGAPAYNPRAELITGKVCGIQVETIDDPLMKKTRQLDKLVDELAKGKPLEKVLR